MLIFQGVQCTWKVQKKVSTPSKLPFSTTWNINKQPNTSMVGCQWDVFFSKSLQVRNGWNLPKDPSILNWLDLGFYPDGLILVNGCCPSSSFKTPMSGTGGEPKGTSGVSLGVTPFCPWKLTAGTQASGQISRKTSESTRLSNCFSTKIRIRLEEYPERGFPPFQ